MEKTKQEVEEALSDGVGKGSVVVGSRELRVGGNLELEME